jgi:pimeloyl-ACP methyl ester carboxylesterase
MTNYVLVHGAWHGSWCWSRVRSLLTASGHEAFTPTLTGLGERSHLLSRTVGLDTHIRDIANLLTWEDLHDVVLVGHSYGGIVVRHIADQMPERIRSLVYLDAFVPDDGKSLIDYVPTAQADAFREQAKRHGDGWKVPPIPAAAFGVNAADAERVDRKCTMHPLACFEAPAKISGAHHRVANIGYISAGGFDGPFKQFADMAARRGWWHEELACGHDVMLDMPYELYTILLQRASSALVAADQEV